MVHDAIAYAPYKMIIFLVPNLRLGMLSATLRVELSLVQRIRRINGLVCEVFFVHAVFALTRKPYMFD